MSSIPIAVFGALGRMGQRVIALAGEHGCHLSGALVEPGDARVGERQGEVELTDKPMDAARGARVVVDFALVGGFAERVAAAAEAGAALVTGVTALSDKDFRSLEDATAKIPVLWAPNMSQGVNALLDLVERAARALPNFELEVHELHHRHKADAPSGTAVALARRLAEARDQDPGEALSLCRERDPGARRSGEIGVVATRGGDTVGEHVVYLFGAGERIEIAHRATSRDIFVHGALRAARFVDQKPAGRYTMAQVLEAR